MPKLLMPKKLKLNSSMKIYKTLKCQTRKSRDTWSKGKCGLGVQNEAGQRLTEFCQENALVIANTLFQKHKRWFCPWTSPDDQYQNQIDDILCSWRRGSIQSAKTRLGADCGLDYELLTAKFRLKWIIIVNVIYL